MKKFLILFLLLLQVVSADNFTPPHARKRIVTATKTLQGLILVPSTNDLSIAGSEDVHGVLSYHLDLPGPVDDLLKGLEPYIGETLTPTVLADIKKHVIAFYEENEHPFLIVSIPEQNVSNGTVKVVVQESRLGNIKVKGNKWFSDQCLEKQVSLEHDEFIAPGVLDQDLYWLNRNPFRQVDAIYTPGEQPGTTDVELLVHDRFPFRAYTGIDNTGNDVTGNNRFFVGLDWGNVFGTDQRLSYQFSTSTDFKRFNSHTLFYTAPLPWRHLLNIYGGYSSVDADFYVPNLKGTSFHMKGFSVQASLRYDIPLPTFNTLLHDFSFGFDFKRTNNNLDLGGAPIISQNNINLTQIMFGYNLGYEAHPVTLSFEIEGFWSPGKWISDQTNADYQSLRPFAKNQYLYGRTAFTLIWEFYKKWSFHTTLRGQLASINLLPSEEFGVGGSTTVRGYKERLVNGDNVFIGNVELRTPPVSPLNALSGWKKYRDEFQFLVFFDYGFQQVKQAVPQQNKTNNLYSVGPGARYQIPPFLTFKVDWGFQLHRINDPSIDEGPQQRLHFSLVVGF